MVNRINIFQSKGRLFKCIKKYDPTLYPTQQKHFKFKYTKRVTVKRMEKDKVKEKKKIID